MDIINDEIFNIAKVQVRTLAPVKAITPFEDSTMGPFEVFNISVITLTDEDGNIGEAPVFSGYTNVLENCILPILFHSRNLLYHELYPRLYWPIRNEGFRGPASALLGQLDMALYDLASRRKKLPLYKYLNATRNYALMYGSGGGTNYSYSDLEKEINYFLGCGIDCIKIKVGKDRGTKMKEDIQKVKFVRRLIGNDPKLAVDANQIWSVKEALDFINAIGNEKIAWFEEPVHSATLTDIEQLCKESPVSIAFGESERSGKVFPALVKAGVSHLQPIPNYLSSIKEWMEVKDLAIKHQIEFSSGGYSLYTSTLMTTAPEKFRVEYLFTLMSVLEPYFSVHPTLEKGRFVLPDIEGLPIRIDWNYWERKNKVIAKKNWTAKESITYSPSVLL
jgi:L-alanine-DL-glutamate epimerase-like enolase superfamily enzyme